MNLSLSDLTFAGYLSYQEHANLMAAVQMQKVQSKKENVLDRLLVLKYIISFQKM